MSPRSVLTCLALSTAASAAIVSRAVTLFPRNGQFDYQIGGSYTPSSSVQIVTRDVTETPVAGKYNICYVNAFQTQPGDQDWWLTNHKDLVLLNGNKCFEDPDWKGECILDTSTDAKRTSLAGIINQSISTCAQKGFQAVELDNLDSFTRSKGRLTKANNVAFATLLVKHGHSLGLAMAQKNTAELESQGKTQVGFDFAVAEECSEWEECDVYDKAYGDYVIEIEYTDSESGKTPFNNACKERGSRWPIIWRDRDVVASNKANYHYEFC